MEEKRIIYFRFKLLPDKEYRISPPDENYEPLEDDINECYRFRQDMRLYYLNWFDVVQTWRYLIKYYYPFILLGIWAISRSWLVGIPLFVLWATTWYLVNRKSRELWSLRILIPGLLDPSLVKHFGNLPPFTER